ncbi:MAG: MFS transporter, partial [Limnochordia bacterium]
MKPQSRFELALLASVPLIMVLGNTLIFPIFPRLRSELGLSMFQTGLLVLAISGPSGLLNPLSGYISDHIGRKKLIVPLTFLYGIGGIIAGLALLYLPEPFVPILVGRIIQGIGSAGPNGIGKVLSPILGAGMAALFGWRMTFFIYPLVAFPVALAVWFFVHEPETKNNLIDKEEYREGLKGVFSQFNLPLVLLIGSLVISVILGSMFLLTELLPHREEATSVLDGLILALPMFALAIFSILAGWLLPQWGPEKLLIAGLGMMGASLIGAALTLGRFAFFVAIFGLGIGGGLALPPLDTLVTSSVGGEQRGVLTTLAGSL